MANTSIATFSPWGLKPLQPFIINELIARAGEKGMNIPALSTANTSTSTNSSSYAGPRTAWCRVCSNGTGKSLGDDTSTPPARQGFVMGFASASFDSTYGFGQGDTTTIGYDVKGVAHTINNTEIATFPHRVGPGIISIETEFNGAGSSMTGLSRKATIKWKCSTLDQLEYMTPYFLTPKISVILEWGWNNYNNISLLDLTKNGVPADPTNNVDGSGILGMFTNSSLIQQSISASGGNYDCQTGIIVDYGYTINATDGFDCFTVVQNPQFLADGIPTKNNNTTITTAQTEKRMLTFQKFVDNYLDSIGNATALKALTKDADIVKILSANKYFFTSDYQNSLAEKVDGKWIRMDLFVDIFNKFLSPKWKFVSGTSNGRLFQIDISATVLTAHPLLKSTDQDVLIPNAYAPQLISEKPTGTAGLGGKKYSDVTTTNTAAAALYKNNSVLNAKLSRLGLSNEYDDLDNLLNAKNVKTGEKTNFPRLENVPDQGLKAGYYGYLKDIFISVKLIKRALEKNDSSINMLQEILDTVSTAGSKLWQFKIAINPDEMFSPIRIIDQHFSNYNTPDGVTKAKIPSLLLGDSKQACFKEFNLNVKMTGEMAMQAIFGQASGADLTGAAKSQADVKPVMFLHNDRLFQSASIDVTQIDPNSKGGDSQMDDRSTLQGFFAIKLKAPAPASSTTAAAPKTSTSTTSTTSTASSTSTTSVSSGTSASSTTSTSTTLAGANPAASSAPSVSRSFLLTERDPAFMADLVKNQLDISNVATVANPLMPGTELTMTSLGIGGFRFLDMFGIMGVQKNYQADRAVWQVDGVRQLIQNNFWTTTITAKVRPLTIIK